MPVIHIDVYVYHCPECAFQAMFGSYGAAMQGGIGHLKTHKETESEGECEDMSPSDTDKLQTDALTQALSILTEHENTI